MAFQKKTWYNVGDTQASDNNSVANKTNMNDLENRIYNAFNDLLKIESGTVTQASENITLDTNRIFKIGNLVSMQIYFRVNTELPAGTQIVKIPESFKPGRVLCFVGTTNSDVINTYYISNSLSAIVNRAVINPSTCRIDLVYVMN